MNWKDFIKEYDKSKPDESKFIVGIDIGNSTSSISYFDYNSMEPEIIDISGGYGKSSIPTAVQYIKDTKEWVFGEYAVLNKGLADEVTFENLIDDLGKKIYYEIDDKPISLIYILSLYIKEIIGNIKNLNPNAEVAGIAASVPSYITEEAKNELLSAFKMAGYEKVLIDFISDRQCLLQKYCYKNNNFSQKVLIVDFGSREIRSGIYKLHKNDSGISAESISSLFDSSISVNKVEERLNALFTQYYCEHTGEKSLSNQIKSQISSFVYQHKDLFFQKTGNKIFNLYFNFVYPPFQKRVDKNDVEGLFEPFKDNIKTFFKNVFSKTLEPQNEMSYDDIDTVICCGGGFEMLWIRKILSIIFPNSNIQIYKNSKGVISDGACIFAASKLGVLSEDSIIIEDKHQLSEDIGLKVRDFEKEKFIPIIEKNSFWWQKHSEKIFIINKDTNEDIIFKIFKRNENGDIFSVGEILLDNMPKRPKGTTQINVYMNYKTYDQLNIVVKDCGFGELFPKTDYQRTFLINIS